MSRLLARARGSYWLIPTVIVVGAAAVALVLLQVDESLDDNGSALAFTGGPASARSLLSTIAASMLTLTALVFSVTIVVLQLASSQFSPRVLKTFLRDRKNQAALGVFLATYVYALIVLRAVRGRDGLTDLFIPGITITVAFLLMLASIGVFVFYIHHIARSIQIVEVIRRISEETVAAIDRTHERDSRTAPAPLGAARTTVPAARAGVVATVRVAELVRCATKADVVLVVISTIGDFVATGMPVVEVHGAGEPDEDVVRQCIAITNERDIHGDPGFGLRQLVDIAERALSPGTNDPTTAVQCLDQIHELLRRLAPRPLGDSWHADDDGRPRVVVRHPTWEGYVALALDEVRHWGASSIRVHARLESMLDDLLRTVDEPRRPPLRAQAGRLAARRDDLPPSERRATVERTPGGGPLDLGPDASEAAGA